MSDSIWVAVITALGAIGGGIGGGVLTQWLGIRWAREQEARQLRQSQEEERVREAEERKGASRALLEAAGNFRLELEMSAQRQWSNMNVRLDTIRDCAAEVGRQAARVAIAGPGARAQAGRAVADEAAALAARFARQTRLGLPNPDNPQVIGGVMDGVLDLAAFDAKVAELQQVMTEDAIMQIPPNTE